MAGAAVERRLADIEQRCRGALDPAALRTEALGRLRRVVPADAAFFATVDPVTLLFTSAAAEDPLGPATALFLDNEFGRTDVNKFSALARAADPVASLDRAARGERSASARYREIMAPLGLGDELRAALVTGHHCWGVLCLHREDSSAGFTAEELALVRRIAPHLAAGLRRAVTAAPPAGAGPRPGGVGLILLDADLRLVSMSPEAEQWLADFPDTDRFPDTDQGTADQRGADPLPVAVHAVAAGPVPSTVRIRGRSGQWIALHTTRLDSQIGVVVEPARPAELGAVLLSAHGLTQAQTRVAALVIRGRSTRELVEELHISANTVQEHLTAVFDKFGVRSRRELVAAVLADLAGS
ncbi:LuxR C-terminal-related transcriptional regulator [Kitasatospora azatica]|uniref:LuxR C-terminal-related transcriptional regulator n=1 Tax=Kitasatospora azatica TaxID=58347 RepID=UPI00056A1F62|nr:LuxR C-terminal-related transcriptional regulator [Kitasatospora azatica]